jgi:broad specificity phosphatase PhoE
MEVLYLVRHGETEWNRQRRMQGRLDSRLTAEGRAHARVHGKLLARESVSQMIVSPLGRTRETAELILEGCDIPVTFDERLVERHCGDWEGLTIEEIADRYPAEWAARSLDPFHHRPPSGENLSDMLLLTHFLGLEPSQADRVRQPNDFVYRLTFSDGRVSCDHFRGGEGPHPGLFLHAPDQVG